MKQTSPSEGKMPQPIPTETDPQDAITLLTEDHEQVRSLFEQYEELGSRAHASKQKLALQICEELTKHATIEEEIFYPAVRKAAKANEDLVDESIVEHASAKDLIAQLMQMDAGDELFDALILLAAGELTVPAIAAGYLKVQQLMRDMAEGRQARLERLGFSKDAAHHLSSLHTRNFM